MNLETFKFLIMKTIKLLFTVYLILISLASCSTGEDMEEAIILNEEVVSVNSYLNYTIGEGPYVYFEDLSLKEILLNNFSINNNKDNEITFIEALNFNDYIDVFNKGINSLVGLEKFENITGLNCSKNQIQNIDLSKNLKLQFLNCGNNLLSEINLEQHIVLKRLDIRNTKISELDITNNINLERVVAICNYKLESVNAKNGYNNRIGIFYLGMSNPNLECIQVDDISLALSKNNWTKPNNTSYTLECSSTNQR